MIKQERSTWQEISTGELYYTTKVQHNKEFIEFYSLETNNRRSLPVDDFLNKFKWKSNIWEKLLIKF